ncbi:phytosulfokines [Neltuma alba]|uniref:phytosulfokines n=1 Tax=Neltuma alba TaxID=207710 RepID=UPI0010A3A755|nr:phytosulfokines-like [Prosopis alba]
MKMSWSNVRTCICMSFFFLFFLFSISRAGRPVPSSSLAVPIKTQHKVNLEVVEKVNTEEESCEGVGEEECLMRRTLAAHLDYIYTQKHKPYKP